VVSLGEKAVLAEYDINAADNLRARKALTQVHVISKTLYFVITLFTLASVLMLFQQVQQFGTSILASAAWSASFSASPRRRPSPICSPGSSSR